MKRLLLLLTILSITLSSFAQNYFEGKIVYTQKMDIGFASKSEVIEYYKGRHSVSEMPAMKMKIIYRDDKKELTTIQELMGTPMVVTVPMYSNDTTELDLDDSLLDESKDSSASEIQVSDTLVSILGHRCIQITTNTDNEMMDGVSTVWIDTSVHIPYNFGIDSDVPLGLVVKSETDVNMNGKNVKIIKELKAIFEGEIDDRIFALPNEKEAIISYMNENGEIVFRKGDSLKYQRLMNKPVKLKHLEEIANDADFGKKVGEGLSVLDFGATWCGPCRLLAPKMENLAKRLGHQYNFYKIDIDQCPKTAKQYNIHSVPTVILLNGTSEVKRFEGNIGSEEEIENWLIQNQ